MSRIDPIDIIAEAGVNHNGSLERALEMVQVAADAGATTVKFQTFIPEKMVSRHAAMADYQSRNSGRNETQLAMLQRLQLDAQAHFKIQEQCSKAGIRFLSAPFDIDSLQLLVDKLGVDRLKIASGELTNLPLLVAAGQSGLPVVLSTGMSIIYEIAAALGALAWGYFNSGQPKDPEAEFSSALKQAEKSGLLREKLIILHCTTQYPTPPEAVNLRAMVNLSQEFGLRVGLSDHTSGTAIAAGATALGACLIEKHFTLDRGLDGPDHAASLEPAEFGELVRNIRDVEAALGDDEKSVQLVERENREVARKSVVAAVPIKQGTLFSAENLDIKRPASGISPINYWGLLGQAAARDYAADEPIDPK